MAKSVELDQIESRINKVLAKFEEIKELDDRIKVIMDKVPPALANLKGRITQNAAYFKDAGLTDKNHKLSFSFYSIKLEITAHIKLNTSPGEITYGVLRTSVYDDAAKDFIHNPAYDMTIDEHGKIDKDFTNDDWAEHYFSKVIWDFYNREAEIRFS